MSSLCVEVQGFSLVRANTNKILMLLHHLDNDYFAIAVSFFIPQKYIWSDLSDAEWNILIGNNLPCRI